MYVDYILVFVLMVSVPAVCHPNTDKVLTEFEKRITNLKTFKESIDGGEGLANGEGEKEGNPSEKENVDEGDYPDKINAMIERLSKKSERCCIMGKILAEYGLRCNNFRFSKASQRVKLRLVNDTLVQLGIHVNEHNRRKLYVPFRICALRNSRDLDRCCLAHEHDKTGHSEMHQDTGKHDSAKHKRHGIKHQHDRIESAKRGFHNVRHHKSKSHNHRGFLDRSNYQWERWADYRELRSKHRHYKMPRQYRSYRRKLRN